MEPADTSHSHFEGLSADRRARLLEAKDDAESSPAPILPSRPRTSTGAVTRELSSSPNPPTSPTPNASSKGRADQLAEQGWAEKRRGRNGQPTSWSIHKIKPTSSAKESKSELPSEGPKLRQPSPTKSNEAVGFLNKYSGRDPKVLKEHYGQLRINGIHVEEYSLVMRNMAAKNRKDREFQERFAGMLAKHDGKKVSAEGGTLDPEGGCYDADVSYISENGDGYRTPGDENMGGIQGNGNQSPEHFTHEREDDREKRAPVDFGARRGSSNKDGDISSFGAARSPHRNPGFREAFKDREHKLAKLKADIAEYRSMDREYRLDIVYDENGDKMGRWIKFRKDKRKLDKLLKKQGARKQGGSFQDRFNSILEKHERKNEKPGNNDGDVEMVDERTMGENGSEHQDNKRKRVEDEDTIMESMKHMRVASGRKRSRNVDRQDLPVDLAEGLSHHFPESRPDRSSRGRSVDRLGHASKDSYRPERSIERRPAYHDMKEELAPHRDDRRGRERNYRVERSADTSHRDRGERDHDFISFSDPRADAHDNRREERTQDKYWKGIDRGEKKDNSTYRSIADNFDNYREGRKHVDRYRAEPRRRSTSPSRDLPETIPLITEGDEQAQLWGEEEKL